MIMSLMWVLNLIHDTCPDQYIDPAAQRELSFDKKY